MTACSACLQEYIAAHPHEAKGGPGSPGSPSMPTRAELHAAGRADLLRAISAAGGSLTVAQVHDSLCFFLNMRLAPVACTATGDARLQCEACMSLREGLRTLRGAEASGEKC